MTERNSLFLRHKFFSISSDVVAYFERNRFWKFLGAGLYPEGGGGITPLLGLYGDVPLDRVWFFGLAVLNRVYNLTCFCPKQGQLS